MRIDSHHHLWDLSIRDQEWITGDEWQYVITGIVIVLAVWGDNVRRRKTGEIS